MTADLSPKVRAEAAKAAEVAWNEVPWERSAGRWTAVVDAVAAVVLPAQVDALKAENEALREENEHLLRGREGYRNEGLIIQADRDKFVAENERLRTSLDQEIAHSKQAAIDYSNTFGPIVRERDQLSTMLRAMARHATSLRRLTAYVVTAPEPENEQLTAYIAQLEPIAEAAKGFRRDKRAAEARVEVLTTALTELVDQAQGALMLASAMGMHFGPLTVGVENARAALAAEGESAPKNPYTGMRFPGADASADLRAALAAPPAPTGVPTLEEMESWPRDPAQRPVTREEVFGAGPAPESEEKSDD